MARAKRTVSERAAARRRYRATLDEAELETDESTEGGEPQRASASPRADGSPRRMGIGAALRAAYRPLRARDDLAVLPSLIVNKALWLPVLVTVLSTVAVIATSGKDTITALLFAYFVQTPAIGGVFLAGFLAPRASWLLGGIVGGVAAICYVAVLTLVPGALGPAAPGAAPTAPSTTAIQDVALSAILLSPVMGSVFASAAAWYKRFLQLTSPNRGRRPQQPVKRVGDGRTRGSSGAAAQKSNAKGPARR